MQTESIKQKSVRTSSHIDSGIAHNACLICYEVPTKENIFKLHRGEKVEHIYDIQCLSNWITQQKKRGGKITCPYDIKPITRPELDRLSTVRASIISVKKRNTYCCFSC